MEPGRREDLRPEPRGDDRAGDPRGHRADPVPRRVPARLRGVRPVRDRAVRRKVHRADGPPAERGGVPGRDLHFAREGPGSLARDRDHPRHHRAEAGRHGARRARRDRPLHDRCRRRQDDGRHRDELERRGRAPVRILRRRDDRAAARRPRPPREIGRGRSSHGAGPGGADRRGLRDPAGPQGRAPPGRLAHAGSDPRRRRAGRRGLHDRARHHAAQGGGAGAQGERGAPRGGTAHRPARELGVVDRGRIARHVRGGPQDLRPRGPLFRHDLRLVAREDPSGGPSGRRRGGAGAARGEEPVLDRLPDRETGRGRPSRPRDGEGRARRRGAPEPDGRNRPGRDRTAAGGAGPPAHEPVPADAFVVQPDVGPCHVRDGAPGGDVHNSRRGGRLPARLGRSAGGRDPRARPRRLPQPRRGRKGVGHGSASWLRARRRRRSPRSP